MVRPRNSREVGGWTRRALGIFLALAAGSVVAIPAFDEFALAAPRKDRVFGAFEDSTTFGRESGTGDVIFHLRPSPGVEPDPPTPILIIPEIQIDGGDFAPLPDPFPPGGRPPFFYDPAPDDRKFHDGRRDKRLRYPGFHDRDFRGRDDHRR